MISKNFNFYCFFRTAESNQQVMAEFTNSVPDNESDQEEDDYMSMFSSTLNEKEALSASSVSVQPSITGRNIE